MYCFHCGAENPNDGIECVACGQFLDATGDTARRGAETNNKAAISLVLGAVSLFGGILCSCACIAGVAAMVLGVWAIVEISQSQGRQTGMFMAVSGSILGVLSLLLPFIMFGVMALFNPEMRREFGTFHWQYSTSTARPPRIATGDAMTELRNVQTAVEAYRVDYEALPASLYLLTTPVPYLARIPSDPNAHVLDQPFDYAYAGDYYALRSVGPDGAADLDLAKLVGEASAAGGWRALDEGIPTGPAPDDLWVHGE